ncbi:MAG: hypothetical protein AAFX80_13440 [Cyanobacteria bacterium J06639_18]
MSYKQLNLFFPTVIQVGEQYIQSINWESWILNPENQRYYLFGRSYASGLNWIAKINSTESEAISYPQKIMEYDSYEQFFCHNEIDSCVSPIKYEYTYLTAAGAAQHNLFYAWKNSDGEYCRISVTKAEVKAKNNPKYSTIYSPIITIQMFPNGQIVEISPDVTLPSGFKTTCYDDKKAIANLHLALEAKKSQSPDAALLLQALMVEICLQTFGEINPGFDLILAKFVDNDIKVLSNSAFKISHNQIRVLQSLFLQSKGWWNWKWENGNFIPTFESALIPINTSLNS